MSHHRLAHLYAAGGIEAEKAKAQLRDLLRDAAGDVRAVAKEVKRTEKCVHHWITAWGLRDWLNTTYPPAGRAKARGVRGFKAKSARRAYSGSDGSAEAPAPPPANPRQSSG